MTTPTKELVLPYTHLEFFDSYVISTFKEDELLDKDKIEELRVIFHDYFGDSNFVYISNRIHKYNVNPVIYIDLIQKNTLLGLAIILKDAKGAQIANFEKQFATIPFEMFSNKEEAIAWTQRLLQDS